MSLEPGLTRKVVAITGAEGSIYRAIAEALACDVTAAASAQAAALTTAKSIGAIDILVNGTWMVLQ